MSVTRNITTVQDGEINNGNATFNVRRTGNKNSVTLSECSSGSISKMNDAYDGRFVFVVAGDLDESADYVWTGSHEFTPLTINGENISDTLLQLNPVDNPTGNLIDITEQSPGVNTRFQINGDGNIGIGGGAHASAKISTGNFHWDEFSQSGFLMIGVPAGGSSSRQVGLVSNGSAFVSLDANNNETTHKFSIGTNGRGTLSHDELVGIYEEDKILSVSTPSSSDIGLGIELSISHTGNAFEVNSNGSSGGDIFLVDSDGDVTAKTMTVGTGGINIGNTWLQDHNGTGFGLIINSATGIRLNGNIGISGRFTNHDIYFGNDQKIKFYGRNTAGSESKVELGFNTLKSDITSANSPIHVKGIGAFASATTNQDGGDVILEGGDPASGGGLKGSVKIDSNLSVQKGFSSSVKNVNSTSYVISTSDNVVGVSHTPTAAVTLTLPSASSSWDSINSVGKRYAIKDVGCNAATNSITINADGSDTITSTTTGNSSFVIDANGEAIWIQAISSTEWIVY